MTAARRSIPGVWRSLEAADSVSLAADAQALPLNGQQPEPAEDEADHEG